MVWNLFILPSDHFPTKIIQKSSFLVKLGSFHLFWTSFFNFYTSKFGPKKLKIGSWCSEFRAYFFKTFTLYLKPYFKLRIWSRLSTLSLSPSNPKLLVQRLYTHTKHAARGKKLVNFRLSCPVRPIKGNIFKTGQFSILKTGNQQETVSSS